MTSPASSKREQVLRRLRAYLARERMPRLIMGVIVLITWGAGFFCSRTLLALGLDRLGVRYCIATFAAWGTLIVLVRAWIAIEQNAFKSAEDVQKLGDQGADDHSDKSLERAGDVAGSMIEGGADLDTDGEGCLLAFGAVVFVFVVTATLGGIFSLVAGAPGLLAEALLDVLIASTLARGLQAHDSQWWALGVVRRTWPVAVSTAVALLIAGSLIQWWQPHVRSIGDLVR